MSDSQTILLVIVLFFAPLLVVVPVLRHYGRKKKELYAPQIAKRGGDLGKAFGVVTHFTYTLNGRQIRINVSEGGRENPPTTFATLRLTGKSPIKLTVSVEHTLVKRAKKVGLKDIQLMNPEFDDKFVVQSDSEDMARQILTNDIQNILLTYKDLNPRIYHYGKNNLTFCVGRGLVQPAELDQFIDHVETIFKNIIQLDM